MGTDLMIRLKFVFFASMLISVAASLGISISSAYAFRCGTRLISIGDRIIDVRKDCGKPDMVQAWEEERILRDFGTYRENGSRYPYREPFLVKVHVKVEEWIYNLGPNRFIRILRFENGRLVDIATGERGYSD